jgi:hypothetical protein
MDSIDTSLLARADEAAPIHHTAAAAIAGLWTETQVAALMDELSPCAERGTPQERQRLSAAYLAGIAHAVHGHTSDRGLVDQAIGMGRTLLKNRAATPDSRLRHAFLAGTRAAMPPAAPLKLFIRQPFTESGPAQQDLVAAVLQRIDLHNGNPYPLRYLSGAKAETADTFRSSFEAQSGLPFTPHNFRTWRLGLLAQADAFINIRVGMSESGAFELAYHLFRGACTPVLFLVWKHAPIKTTLLRDLEPLCDVTYVEFEHADDIGGHVEAFLRGLRR